MNRTLISVCMLFAMVVIALKLVLDSGSVSAPPERAKPTVAEDRKEESPPVALRPDLNKSSLLLRRLPCEGEDECCGHDGLPSPAVMAEKNVLPPVDHLGRLAVDVDLDAITIPVPVPDDSVETMLVRLANFQEEANADDNETPGPAIESPDNPLPKEAPTPGSEEVLPIDTPRAAKIPAKTPPATQPQQKLSPEMQQLKDKIRTCLAHYYFNRQETVAARSPWGVMHSLIAYGVDTQVIANNRRVNSIGWLCYNGTCKGQNIFYLERGELKARIGPGVQGHPGQFLAMMAQSRVKSDFPMLVEGRQFTINDLIKYEQNTCRAGTELTFKLIAFNNYLKTDATWKNDLGEDWDIPRVIREELKQPIVGAACGGTHRLMGLSYSVRKRETQGEPIDGQWLRAKNFTASYQEYLLRLQNPDGSFSTDWFKGRGDNGKPTRKLETTGHMLEWLVYSLPKERLTDPRVIRSVDFLASLLLSDPYGAWNIGPQGHSLHALALYDERVFGGKPGGERSTELARELRSFRR